jgi:predicted GH43/DUF377 family glycosyl hydrolase
MAPNRGPVIRYEHNPILTKRDVPYEVETVHNAAVAKVGSRYVMVFRSHLRSGRSILGVADSPDGLQFVVRPEPFMTPATQGPFATEEEYGVEDPRITHLEGRYYITYSAYSRQGVRIGLAVTDDFTRIERVAMITEPDHRNVVLFPVRVAGRFARLDRPHSHISKWSIWISYSPDLVHWGDSQQLIAPAPYHWDEMKIGPGAPPLLTDRGWLVIYHGAFETMAGAVYRLGVALLEKENPSHVLGVGDDWILQPEDPWEVTGYVPNVVFSCGAIPEPDGSVKLYWGGADSVMCVGSARMDELIERCVNNGRPSTIAPGR